MTIKLRNNLWDSMIGSRTDISSQNSSRISWAAIMFSSLIICSTWNKGNKINEAIYTLFFPYKATTKAFLIKHAFHICSKNSLSNNGFNEKVSNTRMRAVASWPVSRSLAMSRRICFIWISLLFLSNFIRGIVNLSRVLLFTSKKRERDKNKSWNLQPKKLTMIAFNKKN